jgi:hypothetical protein
MKTCPDCGAPIPENSAWCPKCGSTLRGRSSYAETGAAIRQAQQRAVTAGDLTGRDWKVLTAVFALVASYSRLTDRLTVSQLAAAAGVDERSTKRSLARLRDRGVITRTESRGRRPAETGLPPAQQWSATTTVTPEQGSPTTKVEPGAPTTTVASEQWSATSTVGDVNGGRNGPPTVVADDHPPEKTEKKAARARDGDPASAPSGLAGGRPAHVTEIHDYRPTDPHLAAQIERARLACAMRSQLELAVEPGRGDEIARRAATNSHHHDRDEGAVIEQEAIAT